MSARRWRGWVAMLAALLLAACGDEELYTRLSEQQANEMIALLTNAGVAAGKSTKDGVVWAVSAPSGDFSRSVELLGAHGYPKEEFENLGHLFKREGFVSSPTEERARLNFGLSQELSNTISSIDGVLTARVHLAMPEKDPLVDKPRPASAAVFIKFRPGVDLTAQVGQIKALVVNSVDGLPYENVTVAMFPAQASPLAAAKGSSRPSAMARDMVLGISGLIAVLVAAGLLWLTRSRGWWPWASRATSLRPASVPVPVSK